jgi:hypothetical protein
MGIFVLCYNTSALLVLMTDTGYILCKTEADSEEILDDRNITLEKDRF